MWVSADFFWPPIPVGGKLQCEWKGLPDTPARTDMCNFYATWMRLDGNRNIQCKPNFFLPSQLEMGTHRVAGMSTTKACLLV